MNRERPTGRLADLRFTVVRWLAGSASVATIVITFLLLSESDIRGGPEVLAAVIALALLVGTAMVLALPVARSTQQPELWLAAGTSSLFTLGLISVFFVAVFWPAAAVAGAVWLLAQRRGGAGLAAQVVVAIGTALGIILLNWMTVSVLE